MDLGVSSTVAMLSALSSLRRDASSIDKGRLMWRYLVLCGLLWIQMPGLQAAEADSTASQVSYITLTPPLVGNYQSTGRVRLYKADISLRVNSELAKTRVEYHEPLIRNQLVMLFAQQTEESLGRPEGKEQLRQAALQQVQQVLNAEDPSAKVDDLLFNNLVIQ